MTQEQIDEVHQIKRNYMEHYPDWREGQAFFNALLNLYPKEAEQIRGTVYDPYYHNSKIALNYLKSLD
jgi:hypothetical protein